MVLLLLLLMMMPVGAWRYSSELRFGISIDMSVAFYRRFSGEFLSGITLLSSCLLFVTNIREITLRFFVHFGQSDHPLPLLYCTSFGG